MLTKLFYKMSAEDVHKLDELSLPTREKLFNMLFREGIESSLFDNTNNRAYLYRNFSNKKGIREFFGVKYDFYILYSGEISLGNSEYALHIGQGDCEAEGGFGIFLGKDRSDSINVGIFFDYASLNISHIQLYSLFKTINYSNLFRDLGISPHIFMFLVVSFLGFELGKERINFIKQEFSEWATKKKGMDISKKLKDNLSLCEDENWYYWTYDDFIAYVSTLHPHVIQKIIDVMNTIPQLQNPLGVEPIALCQKENMDLKGKLMGIMRENLKKMK